MNTRPLTQIKCRNGMRLFCLPQAKTETRYVYQEVFENQLYTRHGITIGDSDCLFDVGANIGMFTLFAMRQAKNLKIFAFEPVPPIFEALQANVQRANIGQAHQVHLLNHGLSDQAGHFELTFYPRAPANSTLFPADKAEEPELTADTISLRDMWSYSKGGFFGLLLFYPFRRQLVRRGLRRLYGKGERLSCELKTLASVIDQQNIESVDLLKIDVEGNELAVMNGIADGQWQRIKQMVVEISPKNVSHVPRLRDDLKAKGFRNIALETMGHAGYLPESHLPCNLYASR